MYRQSVMMKICQRIIKKCITTEFELSLKYNPSITFCEKHEQNKRNQCSSAFSSVQIELRL